MTKINKKYKIENVYENPSYTRPIILLFLGYNTTKTLVKNGVGASAWENTYKPKLMSEEINLISKDSIKRQRNIRHYIFHNGVFFKNIRDFMVNDIEDLKSDIDNISRKLYNSKTKVLDSLQGELELHSKKLDNFQKKIDEFLIKSTYKDIRPLISLFEYYFKNLINVRGEFLGINDELRRLFISLYLDKHFNNDATSCQLIENTKFMGILKDYFYYSHMTFEHLLTTKLDEFRGQAFRDWIDKTPKGKSYIISKEELNEAIPLRSFMKIWERKLESNWKREVTSKEQIKG